MLTQDLLKDNEHESNVVENTITDSPPPSSPLSPYERQLQSEHEFINHENIEIDPEFKDLLQNTRVKFYLDEIQTIHLGEKVELGPYGMFYLYLAVFVLPAIFSIIKTFTTEFPNKLFFDGCYSRDPSQNLPMTPGVIPMLECMQCCNGRSFIWTHLIHIVLEARVFQVLTVVLAITSVLFSSPMYSRLMLGENMALFMLTFGVVIRTEVSAWQLAPVYGFGFWFAMIGVSYCVAQSQLKYSFDDSMLGYGDVCDPSAPFPNGTVLFAYFDVNENSSIDAGSLPTSAFDFIKAFALIFVPFIPVLFKMFVAAKTTFSRVGLDHLCRDSKNSTETFKILQYEIEEGKLMDAVGDYAKLVRVKETAGRFFRRMLLCDWKWNTPPIDSFGFFWGLEQRDVAYVLTFCKRRGTLENYTKKEKKALFGGGSGTKMVTAMNVQKFGNKLMMKSRVNNAAAASSDAEKQEELEIVKTADSSSVDTSQKPKTMEKEEAQKEEEEELEINLDVDDDDDEDEDFPQPPVPQQQQQRRQSQNFDISEIQINDDI